MKNYQTKWQITQRSDTAKRSFVLSSAAPADPGAAGQGARLSHQSCPAEILQQPELHGLDICIQAGHRDVNSECPELFLETLQNDPHTRGIMIFDSVLTTTPMETKMECFYLK